MSKLVFNEELGGTTTLQAQNTAANKIINVPAADGVLPVPVDDGLNNQVLTSRGPGASPEWEYLAGTGTVTSVNGSGGATGLTLTGGPITVAGTLTLGGTLSPASGGTGAGELIGYMFGNGPNPASASLTIPNTDINGLGTMSTQNASAVAITGGTVDNAAIGATTPSTVVATQVDIIAQGDLRLQDTTGGQFVALHAPTTITTSYTLTLPVDDGTAGQALVTDGTGVLSWSSAASGDVYGPASATDNAVARYDGTTGKIIQNSTVTIADDGATVIAANSTTNALRITQIGAGNALLVEDAANPDATPFVVTAAGDVGVGTTTPGVKLDVADGFVRLTQDYSIRWHSAGTIRGAILADSGSNVIFQTNSTSTERGRVSSSGVWSFGAAPGAESLRVTPVASAVNYLEAAGGTTGNGTTLSAAGSNANIDITLTPKGDGYVVVDSAYSPNINLTDAATIAWNTGTSGGQVATFTFVSTNRTMGAPTNLKNGGFYALAVIQNAGSNTLTWNAVFKWSGGVAPTLSTAAGARDFFVFRSDGTNLYEQGRSLATA